MENFDKKFDSINPELLHPDKNKKSILMVEDDDTSNKLMIMSFRKKYNVFIAPSAAEALKILENNTINLILMDIKLFGDMNGLELTKLLKKDINYKNIPIIVITAYAFTKDRENSLAAGGNEYFSKPIYMPEITNAVDRYLID